MIDFILSSLPSSPIVFLIYLGLVSFISILIILLLSKKEKKEKTPKKNKITIDDLIKIAKNKNSTLKDLEFAMNYFLGNFKVEDNEKKSFEFFRLVLNHKNRAKNLFDIFHGKILPANLKYKDRLDELEKKALNRD